MLLVGGASSPYSIIGVGDLQDAVEDANEGAAPEVVGHGGDVLAVAVEDEGVPDERQALRQVGRGLEVDEHRRWGGRRERREDGGKEEDD